MSLYLRSNRDCDRRAATGRADDERERERLAVGGSGARGGLVRRGARGEQSGGWGKREMELGFGRRRRQRAGGGAGAEAEAARPRAATVRTRQAQAGPRSSGRI